MTSRKLVPDARLEAWETRDDESVRAAVDGATLVVAAGAPGIELLPESVRQQVEIAEAGDRSQRGAAGGHRRHRAAG